MAWYLMAAAVVATIAWVLHQVWQRRPRRLDFPVVGSVHDADQSRTLIEGYKMYPNTPFIMASMPDRVVLPMCVYQELAHAPETQLSFDKDIYYSMLGHITGIGDGRPEETLTIKHDLTKSVANILPLIQAEAHWALAKEIGQPEDWKSVRLYGTLVRIIAHLGGRIFVGLPLSRDEGWLKVCIEFTHDVGRITQITSAWGSPHMLRLVAPFLPEVRKIKDDLRRAKEYITPLIRDVMLVRGEGDEEKASSAGSAMRASTQAGSRATLMSWIQRRLPKGERTAWRLGRGQMVLTFTSLHTTSQTAYHVLVDLACRPQCVQELREEFDEALRETGLERDEDGNEFIGKTLIARLRKLDSFVKECLRMYPVSALVGNRMTTSDLKLSTGHRIPRGTHIAFPLLGVLRDETVEAAGVAAAEAATGGGGGDPDGGKTANKWPGFRPLDEFDGFRYARLRELPGNEARFQAATTACPSALSFGHGTHACPGRFFAMYEIKLLVLELLQHYEFRLKGDVEGVGGVDKRPPNAVFGMEVRPNMEAELEFRKRRV